MYKSSIIYVGCKLSSGIQEHANKFQGTAMNKFVYKISKHPAETFKELVYYCSESGECTIEQIPHDQIEILQDVLNAEGATGWELIQVSFGQNGVLAFWKKEQQD